MLVVGADSKVDYRGIELGPKLEGLRIVRSGLVKGDRIVVNGLQRVRPGAQVDAQGVAMASPETLAALARQRQAVDGTDVPKVAEKNPQRSSPRG
ncbi:Efflux pump periplasmic linker BepF [compost metagenome]